MFTGDPEQLLHFWYLPHIQYLPGQTTSLSGFLDFFFIVYYSVYGREKKQMGFVQAVWTPPPAPHQHITDDCLFLLSINNICFYDILNYITMIYNYKSLK